MSLLPEPLPGTRPGSGSPADFDTADGVRIDVSDLSVRFNTSSGVIEALGPVSLRVQNGEFVAIVGRSGCGKSTLLKVIGGLLHPSSGSVEINGELVRRPWPGAGVVFQDALLMDWRTVLENVLLQGELRKLPKAETERVARRLLESVGLAGFENKRPRELSGGMRQRVSICRALLHEPSLILMDEPFGALDALTRDSMSLDLQEIWMQRRPTIVFVTHSIAEAVLLADRVIVMSRRPGRILGEFVRSEPRPRALEDPRSAAARNAVAAEIRQLLDSDND